MQFAEFQAELETIFPEAKPPETDPQGTAEMRDSLATKLSMLALRASLNNFPLATIARRSLDMAREEAGS
jgi:hypothetical protein